MKTNSRLLLAVLVTATCHQLLAGPAANTATPHILGNLPDGTPPTSSPRKPSNKADAPSPSAESNPSLYSRR